MSSPMCRVPSTLSVSTAQPFATPSSNTPALAHQQISAPRFPQHDPPAGAAGVPLVLPTHTPLEGAVRRALQIIDKLDAISSPSVCLRLLEPPKEFSN